MYALNYRCSQTTEVFFGYQTEMRTIVKQKKWRGGGVGGVGVTSLLNVADRSYIMQKSIHVKRACDEQLYMFN